MGTGCYNGNVDSPSIISASRRTDIPAFFPDRFAAALAEGRAQYRNPYSGKASQVSLRREDVAAFVFWTRDPRPFLPVISRVEDAGYPFLFQFTLTGMPRELEPNGVPEGEAVAAFHALARRVGPERVLWRFDPILPGEDPDALAARFGRIAAALSGCSPRCTLSLAHPYRKAVRATRGFPGLWEPSPGLREAVERIAAGGRAHGFDMLSCCTPRLEEWGVPAGACVDGDYLKALYPGKPIPAPGRPSRPGCRCAASRDIGTYHTCRHGCLYCYAA